jgi:tRNA(fMet)-specific endonuclease VapC
VRVALDTNRYRDLCDGDAAIVELVETAASVFLPFVALAELRAGFAAGTRSRENERVLRRFLAKEGVDVLWPSESTTLAYADLYRQLRRAGTPIPTSDLWIAALVVEHGLALCTRDAHFDHLPQLHLV